MPERNHANGGTQTAQLMRLHWFGKQGLGGAPGAANDGFNESKVYVADDTNVKRLCTTTQVRVGFWKFCWEPWRIFHSPDVSFAFA